MLICVSLNDGAVCSHMHKTYSALALHPDICTHYKALNNIGPPSPSRENLSSGGQYANNKCADQLAHPHSLISAFVIRFLEYFICKLATGEISIF